MAREIELDHVVKSADGTLYRVRSLWNGIAELLPFDGPAGERFELPVGELRRVPDPRRQLPRITGMPEERPRCAWCSRRLKPVVDQQWAGERYSSRLAARLWVAWDGYPSRREPIFDTLGCAMQFGAASYRGGYRRKGTK